MTKAGDTIRKETDLSATELDGLPRRKRPGIFSRERVGIAEQMWTVLAKKKPV
jgi:hypothetical protein